MDSESRKRQGAVKRTEASCLFVLGRAQWIPSRSDVQILLLPACVVGEVGGWTAQVPDMATGEVAPRTRDATGEALWHTSEGAANVKLFLTMAPNAAGHLNFFT